MPAVPAPPAGATTIILNWHWACAEPPPPIDVAGITVCTSCNIAISVRVGSPGDTGDVTQSILASATSAAADVADTIQTALQTAVPPSVPPSASPAGIPLPDPMAAVAAPPLAAVEVTGLRIDDGVLTEPPASAPPEDLPRHGAPTAYGGGGTGPPSVGDRAGSHADIALGEPTPAAVRARVALLQRWIVRRPVVRHHALASPAAAQARPPKPVPRPPAPSAPTPFILGAGVAAAHDGGIGVITALASGLAMVLLYSISTALRLVLVVPPARAAGANPHPPG